MLGGGGVLGGAALAGASPMAADVEFGRSPWVAKAVMPVNVKDHGARGDGQTDDWKAIQSAIDVVADAGGGMVFFPAGTYSVSAGLEVRTNGRAEFTGGTRGSGVVLAGEGEGSRIVRREGNHDPYLVAFRGEGTSAGLEFLHHVGIRRLDVGGRVEGDEHGEPERGEPLGEGGVLFERVVFYYVEDCYIRTNNGPGLTLSDAFIGHVFGNQIMRNAAGIECVGFLNAVRFSENRIQGNTGVAIRMPSAETGPSGLLSRARGINFVGNDMEGNGAEGILFTDALYTGINIAGNYFEQNFNPGVTGDPAIEGPHIHKTATGTDPAQGFYGVAIVGNRFRYVGETGHSVVIEEGVQGILAGNSLEHAGVPNDSVVGYRFGEAADRWVINQGETALRLIGDCELANPETGVILTAPNGTRYRARVDNEGNLTTEALA